MKKNTFFKIFSVAFIVVALFISCADDNVSMSDGGTVYQGVNLDGGASKSLSTVYDGFSEDYYVWFYKTSTTDSVVASTAAEEWTTWGDYADGYVDPTSPTSCDGVGLSGKLAYNFSGSGSMWTLALQARTTGTDQKVVYEGLSKPFIVNNSTNNTNVYVPLDYMNDTGNGSVAFNHGQIEKLTADFSTTDSDLTWTTETGLYVYGTDAPAPGTSETNDLWSTYTDVTPGSYSAYVKYKSYGAEYEISDAVNVHSNLTATVTGKFNKRTVKDIKVFYHDGVIINYDKTTRTDTNMVYSGEDKLTDRIYTFESFFSLPYVSDDPEKSTWCKKDGYTFIGWYTTDCDFADDNRTTDTAWKTKGFVRTNTNAEGELKQAIYVKVNTTDTTAADLDFVLAYTTMTDVLEENWCYEIHLYARWIPNTSAMGADTTARDNVTLDYSSRSNIKGFNGSANITINTSQTEIQGWTNYQSLAFYADEDMNWVFVDKSFTDNDSVAKTKLSATAKKPASRKFKIAGFYDENGLIVVTNTGRMAREEDASSPISTLLDPKGSGWIHQNADPFTPGEVTLYAILSEEPMTI